MAMTGTLKRWNADRGFGFIAPAGGGHDLFVHISAFPRDGVPPRIGEALTYEFGRGDDGKPRAVRAWRPGSTAPPPDRNISRPRQGPSTRRGPIALLLAITLVAAAVAYGHLEPRHTAESQQARPVRSAAPGSAAAMTGPTPFRCDGRTHCSEMTSCREATYFLENCPGSKMDGDRDGIPCERQWCTGFFGR